ncbi:MAG: phosphatidylglycerol:prolipoprotein diacylglycerol transferase [Patiriisocius sp.]|jgi:phosphatidylglycerol:prolipoprotein diacylglycerol transferase
MWQYPQFDPVAISLGPIQIHWYALSYLIGIAIVWWHFGYRNRAASKVLEARGKKQPSRTVTPWTEEQLSDLIFYGVLGVILGGRVGYMLFYGFDQLLENPLNLFRVWEGGMSFHGGMLGVFIGMYWFGRKVGKSFFEVSDFVAPGVPIALGCGRVGNFINGELPGRITDVSWAVIFPGESVARHPSSLYQAVLEGPLLFILLWMFTRKTRPIMATSGMFLLSYGALRFVSEFLRRPDLHMGDEGFIAFNWLTTGQLLSLPMIGIGAVFIAWSHRQILISEKQA